MIDVQLQEKITDQPVTFFRVHYFDNMKMKKAEITEKALQDFIDSCYDSRDNPYKRLEENEEGVLVLEYQSDSYDETEWIKIYLEDN